MRKIKIIGKSRKIDHTSTLERLPSFRSTGNEITVLAFGFSIETDNDELKTPKSPNGLSLVSMVMFKLVIAPKLAIPEILVRSILKLS